MTLVEGHTFCLSDRAGDIDPARPEGLFVLDTRVLSRCQVRLDGRPLEILASFSDEPFAALFVGHAHPRSGHTDADVVALRRRHIGLGMRERITLRNHGLQAASVSLELDVDADFADLFEVKEGRAVAGCDRHELAADRLSFGHSSGIAERDVVLDLSVPARVTPNRARWDLTLAPNEEWEVCMEVAVSVGGAPVAPRFRCGGDDSVATPSRLLSSWRASLPVVDTDSEELAAAVEQVAEDLGALRIVDADRPDLPVVAAGVPWFMALFGRDALLTSWMMLSADPSLAAGVLETLARLQGARVDQATEEEPGKIVHEARFGELGWTGLERSARYFGSIDATPLFVMLLGELRRWGHVDSTAHLIPHADRALAWIEEFGDRDGDGYVEYERKNPYGLVNQGWKDSWDGVRFADGTIPETPIALSEVQGYVYAAYLARAHIAADLGDTSTRDRYLDKATALYRRFNEDFWSDELGCYVLGLDRDKRQIDAVASNMGHCLWTGIVDPARAGAVAARLLAPDMFSGFGIRTLSTSMAAYNPVSYHNGSVWPHDNALCISGLVRYGFTEATHRVIEGQVAVAAAAADGRMPELFAGFDRSEVPVPARYPASCSPQAWAAASPLLWLRALLRLDVWTERREVHAAPDLPSWIRHLDVRGINVGRDELHIRASRGHTHIELSPGSTLRVLRSPRPALSALFPRD